MPNQDLLQRQGLSVYQKRPKPSFLQLGVEGVLQVLALQSIAIDLFTPSRLGRIESSLWAFDIILASAAEEHTDKE
jgi:hypothetical protein